MEHSRCNPFSVKAPTSARNPGKICLVEDDRTGSDKFLKNGSTILAIGGSRPCHCFNIPAGRYFHPLPQKTGGFWEGQFSAVPKFYGTRPPPLIQSCYNIESSRYSGGEHEKQLVKITDIMLRTLT